MKPVRPMLLLALCGSMVAFSAAMAARQVDVARRRYRTAVESAVQVEADVAELIRLRAAREMIAWRQRPAADVLAQVNAALREAGIATSQLRGIGEGVDAPLSDADAAGRPLRRQSLSIRLESLTPIEIGAFLHQWLRIADQWSVDELELTHRRELRQSDCYDLRLSISAVYYAGF